MRETGSVHGTMCQGITPDWGPLERLLGSDELCGYFMWMFDVELDDGTRLNAYKHCWTRCYLHLTDDSRTFEYLGDESYGEVDRRAAIKAVFEHRGSWEPTPAARKALTAALRRARPHGLKPTGGSDSSS